MFDRFSKFAGRKAVLATAAVLALTTVAPTASFAGGRHWHGGGGAAFAGAAIAGAIGTGLAIAATRDAYAYDRSGPITAAARSITSGPGLLRRPGLLRHGHEYAMAAMAVGSRDALLPACSRKRRRLLVSH